VRPDQWIDGWKAPWTTVRAGGSCRRFLRTYGPARPADFVACSGWGSFVCPHARTMFDELGTEEIDVDEQRSFVLADDRSFRAPSPQVRLLPEYDVYMMAFRERDQLVPKPVRELIANHPRGRYEGPAATRLVPVDGIAGSLGAKEAAAPSRAGNPPHSAPGRRARAELRREAERIGAFLGLGCVLSMDPS